MVIIQTGESLSPNGAPKINGKLGRGRSRDITHALNCVAARLRAIPRTVTLNTLLGMVSCLTNEDRAIQTNAISHAPPIHIALITLMLLLAASTAKTKQTMRANAAWEAMLKIVFKTSSSFSAAFGNRATRYLCPVLSQADRLDSKVLITRPPQRKVLCYIRPCVRPIISI